MNSPSSGTNGDDSYFAIPCLFDRLVHSVVPDHRAREKVIDARAYRNAVRRDLEWLLNSKRRIRREELRQVVLSGSQKAKEEREASIYDFEEIPTSVFNYGIRDFNGASADIDSPVVKMEIVSEIREAIRVYEPRIVYETLKIVPLEEAPDNTLAYSVEAELWVLPEWEQLRIEIDLHSGDCQVYLGRT